MHDLEEDGAEPWTLVSYDYVSETDEMSWPATQFYRVFPDSNRIYGHVYKQEHVGTHSLNVTIADDAGS